MTSTLFKPKQTRKSSIAAQDLLTLEDTVIKYSMLRKSGQKLNIGKWPQRFVILTYDSVYIYANETSKVQNSKFSLMGYNKIARCEVKGQNWCFSLVPAENVEFLETKTFACHSDASRKEWMAAIKNQMLAANNIPKPVHHVTDKFRSRTIIDEDDYNSLEKLVYSPVSGINTQVGLLYDDDDDDDADDDDDCDISSSGSQATVLQTTKLQPSKQAPPHNNNNNISTSPEPEDYESYEREHSSSKSTIDVNKRQLPGTQSKLRIDPSKSQSSVTENRNSNFSQPPRYSSVDFSEEDMFGVGDYANASVFTQTGGKQTVTPSLESMCTVVDPNLDRDTLVQMLEAKQEIGTYLIRKSREGDHKVISYLSQIGVVKHYKILGSAQSLMLDQKISFKCVEDLLRHYTSVEPMPQSKQFLKKGFYHDSTAA